MLGEGESMRGVISLSNGAGGGGVEFEGLPWEIF